jgi:hypothetical protein
MTTNGTGINWEMATEHKATPENARWFSKSPGIDLRLTTRRR